MKRSKRIFIVTALVLLFVVVTAAASFIPTLWLNTSNMIELNGNAITVFYETEKAAAEDVFALAEARAEEISQKLQIPADQKLNMYIYDNQANFQTKKYGLIALVLGLDWYVGDNKGTDVLLTSPANPGKAHSYDDVKDAGIHEMVHAYNSIINSNMQLWLNEGVALYLTNGNPPDNLYYCYNSGIPSYEKSLTRSPVEFGNMGGYDFAHTYIEYLDTVYGWETVLKLLKTNDYEACFQKSAEKIYQDWVGYLASNYNK